MRKQIIKQRAANMPETAQAGIDLQHAAEVDLTSEDSAFPIENALIPGQSMEGWRAETSGPQVIRLVFDKPLRTSQVELTFHEEQRSRTQEFVLRCLLEGAADFRELVRQQYTFSPPATTREKETYAVEFAGVKAIELEIIPDISGGDARASLEKLVVR